MSYLAKGLFSPSAFLQYNVVFQYTLQCMVVKVEINKNKTETLPNSSMFETGRRSSRVVESENDLTCVTTTTTT